jgi:hypothetical protein
MVQALDAIVDALPRIAEMAKQEERAAVVAWLRENEGRGARAWEILSAAADRIERGEHRREEEA